MELNQLFIFFMSMTVAQCVLAGQDYGDIDDIAHRFRRSTKKLKPPKIPKTPKSTVEYENADFWVATSQDALLQKIGQKRIEKKAKNTIFFLGDGMSVATVSAARIYKGQMNGGYGEESSLHFESFPNIAVSKTFCADSQVADSACSATAYLSGIKANIATIGVKPSVKVANCSAQMDQSNHVESALAWAQAAGKSTGIVTTTRVTHASPAGAYAHIATRDWENDAAVKRSGMDPDTCDDIAEQLILRKPGIDINVIMGGGRREVTPKEHKDPETGAGGKRTDGKNLIETWRVLKSGKRANYVWNREGFEKVNATETDYLLGLFNYDHMDYVLDSTEDPSLAEMTKKAIQILSKNPNGYFLFVEGGRIDMAHHDTKAKKALVETIAMDEAVRLADEMTCAQDTLLLVTADHAHVMTFSGYPARGNPILGIADLSDVDGLAYTTLGYANGPGYRAPDAYGNRYDATNDNFEDKDYRQHSGIPMTSETHGGDDVLVYSRGPFSHLLSGVVNQCYIPHVIGYASCTGHGAKYCDTAPRD